MITTTTTTRWVPHPQAASIAITPCLSLAAPTRALFYLLGGLLVLLRGRVAHVGNDEEVSEEDEQRHDVDEVHRDDALGIGLAVVVQQIPSLCIHHHELNLSPETHERGHRGRGEAGTLTI